MGFIKEWGMIAGIAGIALGIFLVLFRELIRRIVFATLTKRQSYTIIIAFMLMVWSVSIYSVYQYYSNRDRESFQLTVLVHGEEGKDELVLTNRGQVRLIYGDANVVETINSKGEATFKQIPAAFFSSDASVEIQFLDPQGEPYRALNPDSTYQLTKGKYISLAVKLNGLGQLKGVVKDFKTGEPVPDVRISILSPESIEAFSNKWGEYILSIPARSQQKFQTIRANKEGYEPVELHDVPIQTSKECPVLMKPKNR